MTRNKSMAWTAKEDEFLAANAGVVPFSQIADKLGRSVESVRQHAWRENIGSDLRVGWDIPRCRTCGQKIRK